MKFECRVCYVIVHIKQSNQEPTNWMVHTIRHDHGNIEIVTCPKCSRLEWSCILDAHSSRIKSGEDEDYC